MVVCECRNLSEGQIREIIRSGCDTLPQLEIVCGLGITCGSCRDALRSLLADEAAGGPPELP